MSDQIPNGREPELGGKGSLAPSLSMDRLLPGLREALESKDRKERLRAVESLRSSGSPPVVLLLIELLRKSGDMATRQRCAAMLGQVGDERALDVLVGLLSDDAADMRKLGAWALGQLRLTAAVEPLIELLSRETHDRVIAVAAASLAEIGDARAARPLLEVLVSSAEGPLHRAIELALKPIARTCSLSVLLDLLRDEHQEVCNWASDVFIGHQESPAADHLPGLERLLDPRYNENVRVRALRLLSGLPDGMGKQYVLNMLADAEELVRQAAIFEVGNLRIAEASDILLERYEQETYHCQGGIVQTLGVLDHPRIVPFLLDRLAESDYRWSIIQSLRSQGGARVANQLIERFNAAAGDTREPYLDALTYLEAPEVAPALLDVARHSPDEEERRRAVNAFPFSLLPQLQTDLMEILRHDPSLRVKHSAITKLGYCLTDDADRDLQLFLAEIDNDHLKAAVVNVLIRRTPDARFFHEQIHRIGEEEARSDAIYGIPGGLIPAVSADLVDILHTDPSVSVKDAVIEVMGRNLTERSEAALRAFLDSTDSDTLRASALMALIQTVPDGPQLLRENLARITDENAMWSLITQLRILSLEELFAWVRRIYHLASSLWVRVTAVEELWRVRSEETLPFLIEVLSADPSPRVREIAASVLRGDWPEGTEDQRVASLIAALDDQSTVETNEIYLGEGRRVCDFVAIYLRNFHRPDVAAALAAWDAKNRKNAE